VNFVALACAGLQPGLVATTRAAFTVMSATETLPVATFTGASACSSVALALALISSLSLSLSVCLCSLSFSRLPGIFQFLASLDADTPREKLDALVAAVAALG
jgi:hypothetical protein